MNLGPDLAPDAKIQRYISFARLVALLETRELHFSCAEAFEDEHDGVFNCLGEDDHYDITNNGEIVRIEAGALVRSAENSATMKEVARGYQRESLHGIAVNCWCMDDSESRAMWGLYGSPKEGVAIQSTVEALRGSVSAGEFRLTLRCVQYIDYAKEKIPINNLMNAFFYKSKAFAYENELRLICYRYLNNGPPRPSFAAITGRGVSLPVDVERLVKSICVSPQSPAWFGELVGRVVRKYGLNVPVGNSEIRLRTR